MAFRKLSQNTAANKENLVRVHTDQGFCCDDAEVAIKTYSNSAHNLGSAGINRIVIAGTTYTFDATATTQAALIEETNKAFKSAGYTEVGGTAVSVSGALAATVASIKTTATITKFITASGSDVALAAA